MSRLQQTLQDSASASQTGGGAPPAGPSQPGSAQPGAAKKAKPQALVDQVLSLDSASSAQPGGGAPPGVSLAEELLQQVRQLGYYPREAAGSSRGARELGQALRQAAKAGLFDAAQLAELEGLPNSKAAGRMAAAKAKAQTLANQVLSLGHLPREYSKEEVKLARELRDTRKRSLFDATQLAQLEEAQARATQLEQHVEVQGRKAKAQTLVDQVLSLGYLPREYRKEEAKVAPQIRDARKGLLFDPAQLAQLAEVGSQRPHPKTFAVLVSALS